MAGDMFLELSDTDGESKDTVFEKKKAIDITDWGWVISNVGSQHVGGGGGTGKASFGDITITKPVDTATPQLMLYCANQKHLKEGTITVRKGGEKPLEYMIVKMKDVIVTQVNTGAHATAGIPHESITLNFSKVEFEYTSQKKDGGKDKSVSFKWDIESNTKM